MNLINFLRNIKLKHFFGLILLIIFQYIAYDLINEFLQHPDNSRYIYKIMTFNELKSILIITLISVDIILTLSIAYYKKYWENINNKIKSLFYILMLASIAIILLLGYLTHGEVIRILLHPIKSDVFMDFFNSIQYGMKPYSRDVIYPPLINVFYGFLGRFVLKDSPPLMYRTSQMGAMVFLIYNLFVYGLFIYALKRFINKFMPCSDKEKMFFAFIILFSTPYLFMMERCNSIIISLSSIMLFLIEYKNNNSILKQGLLLGVATSIKISPILIGILYIKDKRYKDGFLCLIIVCLLFNIPFVFTDGNIFTLLENIHKATSYFQGSIIEADGTVRAMGYGVHVNIDKFFEMIGKVISVDTSKIAFITKMIICILGTALIFTKKIDLWKIMALLISIIVLVPGFSAVYNLTYYTIPLIIFLNKTTYDKMNYIYMLLFLGIFMPIVNVNIPILHEISSNDIFKIRLSTVLESICALLMSITIIIDCIFSIKQRRN